MQKRGIEAQQAVYQRRAEILVEAHLTHDDRKTAERHGVSDRTLRNWRGQLSTDGEFAKIFQVKKFAAESQWADRVPSALRQCIEFVEKAARDGDHKDPKMVHSIAGAFKLLSEGDVTSKMLDRMLEQRFGITTGVQAPGQDRAAATPVQPMVPAGGAASSTATAVTH
jgi:transposase-like protein